MLALSVSAAFAAESLDTQTVKEFRLPEYDEKGNLKSETLGDYAKVKPDGVTEITNLKMNMYKDGQVEASVTAPNCTLDPNGGRAGSEGPVRISRENMVITGEGFYWSKSKERIQIFKNVKVVLKDVRSLDAGVKK
ncbi:MAG TPA: hypothetical protein DCZ95_06585 [Verrucomicrobia bacterium]|nr:MAG: hypothetical protein A2X46_16070 [Lentisphaerae bacterium GWF2_57_35]HBA83744.1 hypothetical protein [Verrucomicrobiota bacterium]